MALKLNAQTDGKLDGLGFLPSDLIANFAAFTGRKERTEEDIDKMVNSLLAQGQINNISFRKGFGDVAIPMSGHTRILAADRITTQKLTGYRINPKGEMVEVQYGPENPFILYGTYKRCNELEAMFHTFTENDDDTRKPMNGVDIAMFIDIVSQSYGISDAEIAKRLGKQPSQISNYRKFLELDQATQTKISRGEINDATALALTVIAPEDRAAAIETAKASGKGKVTATGVRAAARANGARTSKPLGHTLTDFRTAMRLNAAVCKDAALKALYEALADKYWTGEETDETLTNMLENMADVANA